MGGAHFLRDHVPLDTDFRVDACAVSDFGHYSKHVHTVLYQRAFFRIFVQPTNMNFTTVNGTVQRTTSYSLVPSLSNLQFFTVCSQPGGLETD